MRRFLQIFVLLLWGLLSGICARSQSIITGTVRTPLCPGDTVRIPFTLTGVFNPGNILTAQLSDATGSFTSPTSIGFSISTVSAAVIARVPFNVSSGSLYRVRVVSSNPAVTGADNASNLTINANSGTGILISSNISTSAICSSTSVTFNASVTNGGATPAFQWYKNQTVIGTGNSVTYSSWNNGDTVYCKLTGSNGCSVSQVSYSNIILVNTQNANSNTWQRKINLGRSVTNTVNLQRIYPASFSIGNKGYVICGKNGSVNKNDNWEFDPVTNVWTQKAGYPGTPRSEAVGFSIGKKGYAGGGIDQANLYRRDFYEFDPASNVWIRKDSIPYPTGVKGAFSFAIGNRGYVGGGAGPGGYYDTLFEYNPDNDAWISRAGTGIARYLATATTVSNKGYVSCGLINNGIAIANDLWEYNPSNDSWTQKSNFPGTARYGMIGAGLGNSGYFGLGYDNANAAKKDFYKYNPATNSWTPAVTFPGTARYGAFAFGIGSGIITGAGLYKLPSEYLNDCWEYDTLTAAWTAVFTDMAYGRNSAFSFSIGNSGYLGTGNTGSKKMADFWEYDGLNGTWTQRADFAGNARAGSVGLSILNKGYAGMGVDANNNFTSDFYEYDPLSNTWTSRAGFSGGTRAYAAAFSIGEKGYVGTGQDAVTRFADFWEFNPLTNSWRAVAPFPGTARFNAVGFSIENKGYIGTGSDPGIRGDFYEYDPSVNSWTQKARFGGGTDTARTYAAGFSIGTRGYVGTGNSTNGRKNDLWEFDPATNSWLQKANLPAEAREYTACFSIGNQGYLATGNLVSGPASSDLWEYSPGNQKIFVTSVPGGTICSGSLVQIGISTGCNNFNAGNIFSVQLSDSGGSFMNPVIIGTYSAVSGGTINAEIPAGMPGGDRYRIRVLASNPSAISAPALQYLSIRNSSNNSVSISATATTNNICSSSSLQFAATAVSSGNLTYQWYKNSSPVGSNQNTYSGSSWANGDTIRCKLTTDAACASPASIVSNYIIVSVDTASANRWVQKAAMGWNQSASLSPRESAVAFTIGNKGYIGTGQAFNTNSGALEYYKDFWEYDPGTNAWTQRADLSGSARSNAVGISIGAKGYISTGTTGVSRLNDLWEYDPASNSWTQKANFTGTARSSACGFSIGTKGYLGTGFTGGAASDFYEYNPQTNAWTAKAAFGGGVRYGAAATSCGGKGYIGTGYNGSLRFADFWEYDPQTNVWTQKTILPAAARMNATAFGINGRPFIACGSDASGNPLKDSYQFDPGTNTWTRKNDLLGPARSVTVSFVIANDAYVSCGLDSSGNRLGDLWKYNSLQNNWTQLLVSNVRTMAIAFTVGNKGYVGTGAPGFKDLWAYDPAANAWTQKADFGGGIRQEAIAFSIGSKGYVGTGSDGTSYKNDLWEFDPASNTWTQKTNFPGTARGGAIAFSINNKGYVGTGMATGSVLKKDLWEYDPLTDNWTQKTDFPGTARKNAAGFNIGNKGYLTSGYNGVSAYYIDLWQYSSETDSWLQKANFPGTARKGTAVFSMNTDAFLTGGSNNSNRFQDSWEYDSTSNAWTQKANFGGGLREFAVGFAVGSKGYVGTGNKNDLWEYQATNTRITTGNPAAGPYCAGSTIKIPFTIGCNNFVAGNIFTAQLSDSTGSFSNPVNIGTLSSTGSDSVNARIPDYVLSSSNYAIRIIGSSPLTYGSVSGNIAINSITYPTVTISSNINTQNLCSGTSITLSPTLSGTGASAPSYRWYRNNSPVYTFANYTTGTYNNGDTFKLWIKILSPPACRVPADTLWSNNIMIGIDNPAANSWTQKAALGSIQKSSLSPRESAIAFSIGAKGYIGTGYAYNYATGANEYYNDFWEYDAANGYWTQRANFGGAARSEAIGFNIGTRGYAGTGINGSTYYDDFWEYNPATNKWTPKTTLPGGTRKGAIGFGIGTKGYAGTGFNGTAKNDFYEYDPVSNTWTAKAVFGGGNRYWAAGFSAGTKGYAGTGYNGSSRFNDFWEYDPAANNWVQKTSFPGTARSKATGFGINGMAYIATGSNGTTYYNDCWEFNPSSNSWIRKTDLGGDSRESAIAFTIGNNAYLGTGYTVISSNSKRLSDLWQFDPQANAWSEINPPTVRKGAVGLGIMSKGYVGTGYDGSYRDDFWEYDPALNTWTQKADFAGGPRTDATGFVIGSKGYITTGFDGGYKNDLWEFDPATNAWIQKANLPGSARYGAGAFSISNKGYVVAGWATGAVIKKDLWEYNVSSNSWTQKTDLPGAARQYACGFSLGNKGYVCLGNNGASTFYKDLWQYDPAANSWAQKTDFGGSARMAAACFSIGAKAYVATGMDNSIKYQDHWEYDSLTNAWTSRASFGGGLRDFAVGFSIGPKGYLGTGSMKNDFWEYNPTNTRLTTNSVNAGPYCPGAQISVPFGTGCNALTAGNIFTAQLSDSLGNFTNPENIGTLAGTTAGTIAAALPPSVNSSSRYRIRVVSSSPASVGTPNNSDITIRSGINISQDPDSSQKIYCLNSTVTPLTISAQGGNLSYQWFVNSSPSVTGATPISTGGNSNSYAPPSDIAGDYYYFCSVNDECNIPDTSQISGGQFIKAAGSWKGITAEWNNAANWCGGVPTSATNVSITGEAVFQPVITNNTALVKNLDVQPGAGLTISNQILKLYGSLSGNGNIDVSEGTLEFSGAAAQSVSGSVFTNRTVRNFTVSNPAGVNISSTANDTLRISGLLSFGNVNNSVLNSGNNLTIMSDSAGTASVADLTNGGINFNNSITGNVTVERYITLSRKWQLLSIPTNTVQTVNQAWQEGNASAANVNPGYGTIISDSSVSWAAKGFDFRTPSGPSMKSFVPDTAGGKYVGIPNTNIASINSTHCYMAYIRGDRTATPMNTINTKTKLRTTGPLKQGTQAAITVPANTFVDIGNPFASAIDIDKVSKPGIQDFIYIWDPMLGGSYGAGGFQTLINGLDGNYYITPGNGSYPPALSVYNNIQSGQGFFVRGANGGSVILEENDKVPGCRQVLRPGTQNWQLLRANLKMHSADTLVTLDGALLQFGNSFSNQVTHEDGFKLMQSALNVAIRNGNNKLVVDRRRQLKDKDTVFLHVTGLRPLLYQWEIDIRHLAGPGISFALHDKFTGSIRALQAEGITEFDFSVSTAPGSADTGRFFITAVKPKFVPLAFTSLSAGADGDSTGLTWTVKNYSQDWIFDTEISRDGKSFTKTASTLHDVEREGKFTQRILSENKHSSDIRYRIKASHINGTVVYSGILHNTGSVKKTEFASVYPNPVTSGRVTIRFHQALSGKYSLEISDNQGRGLLKKAIYVSGISFTKYLDLKELPTSGKYDLLITNEKNEKQVLPIIFSTEN